MCFTFRTVGGGVICPQYFPHERFEAYFYVLPSTIATGVPSVPLPVFVAEARTCARIYCCRVRQGRRFGGYAGWVHSWRGVGVAPCRQKALVVQDIKLGTYT